MDIRIELTWMFCSFVAMVVFSFFHSIFYDDYGKKTTFVLFLLTLAGLSAISLFGSCVVFVLMLIWTVGR
jgi:hypothetical protein